MVNNFLFAIRPINLLIVFLNQSIFFFLYIKTGLVKLGLTPQLSDFQFFLFSTVTIILAASSYLINDYYDIEIDKLNQIRKSNLSKRDLLVCYLALLITGTIIALFISFSIQKWHLFCIYPLVAFLLFLYSYKFKLTGVIGNLVVAGFTAFVSLILLIAEPQLLTNNNNEIKLVCNIIVAFSLFGFLSNLIREMIKDVEDQEGDRLKRSNSLPLIIGERKTKQILHSLIILLSFLLVGWTFCFELNEFRVRIFNIIFIVGPLSLSLYRLRNAQSKNDYHNLSTFYKWVMLSGMISILLLSVEI